MISFVYLIINVTNTILDFRYTKYFYIYKLLVHVAREKYLPYPQRCIRTERYLYIINFEPDRWPMGDPKGLDNLKTSCNYEKLRDDTFEAYPGTTLG